MRVRIDKRGEDYVVAVDRALFDPDDLAVRDDDPALDGLEVGTDEDRPLQMHVLRSPARG